MPTALHVRDAGKYLDLAAVAADLRRQGAGRVRQDLLDHKHSSSMILKATLVATRDAAQRIIEDTIARARARGLSLVGQIDDEIAQDDQHLTLAFMAIIDTSA